MSGEDAMKYRMLGRTGMRVSEVSFGAGAIGSSWSPVDDEESLAALGWAVDLRVNFLDTADVCGDGRSERLIEYPGVETMQIIYNMFRQRPAELFFREAMRRKVGIIVWVLLASGLLTGKMSAQRAHHDLRGGQGLP
jgi:aryl-alcohol dehydrogenase-like predicted oxidoreductase